MEKAMSGEQMASGIPPGAHPEAAEGSAPDSALRSSAEHSALSTQHPALSVTPEIEALRELLGTMLREIGADQPDEIDSILAEVRGVSRLVSTIVTAVRLENELHPADDGGVARGLEAIIARAVAVMGKK
jgi:hypothetical protein